MIGADWQVPSSPLRLADNGRVMFDGQNPCGPLRIAYRQGGEVMHLADRGHRDLKRLLNERAVPGFVRGRLPLLFRGDELLAVANLPGLDGNGQDGWKLHWQPTGEDLGLS